MNDDTNPTAWERGVLERLLRDTLTEQRRARRWRIFFRLLSVLLVLLVLGLFRADVGVPQVASRHTALVQLNGIIAPGTDANADIIIESLRKAYENTQVAGVVLRIDSPGGSPVQAGRINAEIRRLRELHPKVPLYAVIDDICASGGYYVAVAADRIYADKASVVGSIGVLMNGFGFVDAMQKLGIERRLLTAGEHKGFLDPFSPQNPEDADHARELLQAIHSQFIEVVKAGPRGAPEGRSAPVQRAGVDRRPGHRTGAGRCAGRHRFGGARGIQGRQGGRLHRASGLLREAHPQCRRRGGQQPAERALGRPALALIGGHIRAAQGRDPATAHTVRSAAGPAARSGHHRSCAGTG